ncbi:MAG: DNA polymerase Y family protein [Pseudomonadales bacterium]|nr:DNA polymerase Y family protein [Pseudomonadales bacterium]
MYWLCVALPKLPLEVFQPSDQAVAVVEQQRVLLCNEAAGARGIEAGLNVSTALALANELVLVERDLQREQQRLTHLAEWLYRFSSQLLPYQNCRGNYSLLLEIGGSLRLFNGLHNLLAQLSAQLRDNPLNPQGFTHNFGLAHTLKAAELSARFAPVTNKTIAATGKHDPAPGIAQRDQTPVALLDCEAKAIAQCEDLGLVTLGDVLALPEATLGKRFNAAFMRHLDQLQGKSPDPQTWYQPANHFNRELFYIDGLRSHADLQYPMQQLLQVFCHYLQQRQLSCNSIRWSFTRFSKKKHSLRVHLSRAQANYHNLLELSALQLEQLPLDSPVECVALQCQQLLPAQQQHLDLFAKPDNKGDFSLLADKLTGKLGNEVLWQAGNYNQPLPEQANAAIPFAQQASRKANPTTTRATAARKHKSAQQQGINAATANCSTAQANTDTLQQPSWLLREPLPLEHCGKQVFLRGKQLFLLKGPQRLDCNWWSKRACRDYFVAGLACQAAMPSTDNGKNKNDNFNHHHAGQHIKQRSKHPRKQREKSRQHYAKASLNTAVRQWAGFYWIYYDALAKRWYLHGEFA